MTGAAAIAGRRCDSATRHEGRCIWVGPKLIDAGRSSEVRAVEGGVHDGNAGIGTFLPRIVGRAIPWCCSLIPRLLVPPLAEGLTRRNHGDF